MCVNIIEHILLMLYKKSGFQFRNSRPGPGLTTHFLSKHYGSRIVPGQKNILSGGRHLISGGRHLTYVAAAT